MTTQRSDAADPTAISSRSLAASLAGVLVEACGGRLSNLTWFKADWQRGGAATATAAWNGGGQTGGVVAKLPVVQRELVWMRRLQGSPVVPKLYAFGQELGGYDLAWIVIERFPYGPLGAAWHDDHAARMADAAASFYEASSRYALDETPAAEDWESLVRDAQESLRINDVPNHSRWRAAVKSLRQRIGPLAKAWNDRGGAEWLHGDLHLANAMSRVALDSGPVCLIDLGDVHAGHWIEDAVYLERQLWSRPQRMKAANPVKAIAAARRAHGLPVEDDYPRLAMIRRALLAGTAPKFLKSEGDPHHLEACLEWLERALPELR